MLPAWATITIAAISAAAGILGALVLTWIRIGFDRSESVKDRAHERELQERRLDHEREEQWRDRRVRAADDFSTGAQHALLRIHEAIQAVTKPGNPGRFAGSTLARKCVRLAVRLDLQARPRQLRH